MGVLVLTRRSSLSAGAQAGSAGQDKPADGERLGGYAALVSTDFNLADVPI